jgi:hypothetical protein
VCVCVYRLLNPPENDRNCYSCGAELKSQADKYSMGYREGNQSKPKTLTLRMTTPSMLRCGLHVVAWQCLYKKKQNLWCGLSTVQAIFSHIWVSATAAIHILRYPFVCGSECTITAGVNRDINSSYILTRINTGLSINILIWWYKDRWNYSTLYAASFFIKK